MTLSGSEPLRLSKRLSQKLEQLETKVEMARHFSRSDRARVVNVWGKARVDVAMGKHIETHESTYVIYLTFLQQLLIFFCISESKRHRIF